jgi:hypothetical protein
LLHLKANRARIFRSSLKAGGGAAWMVHVKSSRMSCVDESEDERIDATDYVKPFYHNFIAFIV